MLEATMTDEPKSSEQAERIRMIFDTEDIIRRAVSLRALKEGVTARREVSKSEIINDILREALADEIAELLEDAGPRKSRRKN